MKWLIIFAALCFATIANAEWEKTGYGGRDWRVFMQDISCQKSRDYSSKEDTEETGQGAQYFNTALVYKDSNPNPPNKHKTSNYMIRRATDVYFKALSEEDQKYFRNNQKFNELVAQSGCSLNEINVGKVSKGKTIRCWDWDYTGAVRSGSGDKVIMAGINDKAGTYVICGYDTTGGCVGYNPNCVTSKFVGRIDNIPGESYDDFIGLRTTQTDYRYPTYVPPDKIGYVGEEYYDNVFSAHRTASQPALMLARLGEASQADALSKLPAMTATELKSLTDRAERGDADAAFTLGLRNVLGWGVPQNRPAALRFFQQATRQGHALSQLALGVQYQLGLAGAVSQERAYQLAYQYFRLAAQGLEDLDRKWAQTQADALKKTVIQRDLERLDAAVARWKPGQALPE